MKVAESKVESVIFIARHAEAYHDKCFCIGIHWYGEFCPTDGGSNLPARFSFILYTGCISERNRKIGYYLKWKGFDVGVFLMSSQKRKMYIFK